MNVHEEKPVIITEEDYQLLKQYISPGAATNEMSLSAELKRAVIVTKDAFPRHTVRLGSKVSVLELNTNKVMEFTIVMPAHADMHQNKISILTPMGAALIGFRKGEEVQWKVPAGLKRFRILDVSNKE
ncbi:MAG TPA: GreA/GreB family elongation factor [Chitinophagaceae bacterium]|nr:GreA/GreB family elongation factor [Chitinophagaceae bacterium]